VAPLLLFIKPPKIGEKEIIKYNINVNTQWQNNKMYTDCHTVHIKSSSAATWSG
jgi:hypothetical protein